ncbi:uncharacterized protein si:ch211-165i18.2 [Myxocyprinus asiaticus]|uniref:uncharacterized protein si:ch211-165i18.2 n=1 Tax=Myxocyprinus asiaticus TaxID=70543 RepID=UPI002222739D|nr:uncharacterized protein si:ch211-165i18.2 [Myxocyprinus asiaticus]
MTDRHRVFSFSMAPMVLFLISALAAWPLGLEAHVVQDFSLCKEFFYKNTEPTGIDQNAAQICQKRGFYYYASLYSISHRMPVYSAYTFDFTCRDNVVQRREVWFIEPQISNLDGEDMALARQNKDLIKQNQALNEDYEHTDYDRGHLNPNNYHCNDGRVATFTLTNAVPMDACFNRLHWRKYEDYLRSIVLELSWMGTPYFVTGAVPSGNRIPVPGLDTTEENREFNRVTVPSHVWTALCFKHNDEQYSFSIGYIGENKADAIIQVMSVPDLVHVLSGLYNSPHLQIFDNDCYSNTQKSKTILQQLFKILHLPQLQKVFSLDGNVQNLLTASLSKRQRRSGSHEPVKKPRITHMTVELNYEDMTEWFDNNENMKLNAITTCVFEPKSNVHSSWPIYFRDELRKARSAEKLDDYICKLIPEKSIPESVITADGTHCKAGTTCSSGSCPTDQGKKVCCTSPCLYDHTWKDFICSSGQQSIRCSTQYSIVTVSGKPCRQDHHCGTYGETYYWCYTVGSDWDYCSPPFVNSVGLNGKPCRDDHECSTYGENYHWCYTDRSNHWSKCCTDKDPYVALNGRTCKPEHRCGTHGKTYLWCYTTDGLWDYCCTQ